MKMGATKFIAIEEKGWNKANSRSLDLIVSTVSSPNMPLAEYFQLLRTNGQFIQVSAACEFCQVFNVLTSRLFRLEHPKIRSLHSTHFLSL